MSVTNAAVANEVLKQQRSAETADQIEQAELLAIKERLERKRTDAQPDVIEVPLDGEMIPMDPCPPGLAVELIGPLARRRDTAQAAAEHGTENLDEEQQATVASTISDVDAVYRTVTEHSPVLFDRAFWNGYDTEEIADFVGRWGRRSRAGADAGN